MTREEYTAWKHEALKTARAEYRAQCLKEARINARRMINALRQWWRA